jgi:CheY-like chemotaxis protein
MHALIIENHLRDAGFTTVDFAVTEAEAVASARSCRPDLITSDVTLPQGCGIAAVEAICGERRIPVVFITATGWQVRERLGDAVVVAKPFGPAQLTRALIAAGVGGRDAPRPRPMPEAGR